MQLATQNSLHMVVVNDGGAGDDWVRITVNRRLITLNAPKRHKTNEAGCAPDTFFPTRLLSPLFIINCSTFQFDQLRIIGLVDDGKYLPLRS